MEGNIENQEKPKYNLLNNLDATLARMGEIEGEKWVERQIDLLTDTEAIERNKEFTTVRAALAWIEENKSLSQEELRSSGFTEDEIKESQDRRHHLSFQIYGDGGFNRWFMHLDGTLYLSKGHANEKSIEKAKSLGFELH
jgi:hypothetical protein